MAQNDRVTYLQHWRHKGIVYRQENSFGLANFGHLGNVCALESRVGRRLNPNDLGVLLDGSLHPLQV